jgi:hypothetical protein
MEAAPGLTTRRSVCLLLAAAVAVAPPLPARAADAPGVPDSLGIDAAADLLDHAAAEGMFTTATAVARRIEEALLPPDQPLGQPEAPLPPRVRKALVRALAVPDAGLQFAAARTLALTAGPPPWPGSSRVVETLAHAATAAGSDRVVVAHHDADVAHEIAADVSRFGYRPVVVSTGRAAVRAARDHADTVLVILGARIIRPSAFETAQFIQEQPCGDIPPVLVVVDPFDDMARGRFLTKSILAFSGLRCVSLVDRMDSFFQPAIDPDTGAELAPARFPAALEEVAGVGAAEAEPRAARAALRAERGKQANTLLAILERRGWGMPASACVPLERMSAGPVPTGYNRAASTLPPPAADDAALPEPTR